ncbi:MAG: M48 family metalloprotease [Alphaproteobacteria bacterium]
MKRFRNALLGVLLALTVGLSTAFSAQAASLIRDAEIENMIRTYATPLMRAAGVDPDAVTIYLVDDPEINAFVAGGMNLFVHTGLLEQSDDPAGVIGVLAHEVGHIAGGHLARLPGALESIRIESLIALVLGAAAIAGGATDAGQAIIAGGTGLAQQGLFRYTRAQEQAADQAGLGYLEATGQSAHGLLSLLEKIRNEQLLVAARQSPYLRTHPLAQDRVLHIRNHIANSTYSYRPPAPEYVEMFARARAKLDGFLHPPAQTLAKYPTSDQSLAARYARAVAYFRMADLSNALIEIDALLAESPRDPYFYELKGQMFFENGRVREAIGPYQEAVALRPAESLFRLELAQAQIEVNDPELDQAALENLRIAVVRVRTDPTLWRYLGIAHGRAGDYGESSLALAEEAFLRHRPQDVAFHLARAEQHLAEGTPGWLRLQDLKRAAEDLE